MRYGDVAHAYPPRWRDMEANDFANLWRGREYMLNGLYHDHPFLCGGCVYPHGHAGECRISGPRDVLIRTFDVSAMRDFCRRMTPTPPEEETRRREVAAEFRERSQRHAGMRAPRGTWSGA